MCSQSNKKTTHNIVIMDFDGVIVEKTSDRHHIMAREIAQKIIEKHYSLGHKIIILSARKERDADIVYKALKSLNIPRKLVWKIYLRKNKETKKEEEWKIDVFKEKIYGLGNIMEYHDDNHNVLENIRDIDSNICLVLHLEFNKAIIYHRTERCVSLQDVEYHEKRYYYQLDQQNYLV